MTREYVHAELGSEVHALSGYYVAQEEKRIVYNSKEVLCLIGDYVTEGFCCGKSESSYAQVAGYIVNWKSKKDAHGTPISEVEPITNEKEKREASSFVSSSFYKYRR